MSRDTGYTLSMREVTISLVEVGYRFSACVVYVRQIAYRMHGHAGNGKTILNSYLRFLVSERGLACEQQKTSNLIGF